MSVIDGLVDSLTVSRSGQVAALATTSYEPKDVHAGPPGGPLIRVSDTGPELRRIRWGTQERLSYRASDGLNLDGLLILPAGKSRADGPFPLITLVHGGPYDRYADKLMLHPHSPGQWLATAGYAVFLPNPRGGQGHGHDFAVAVAGSVGGGEWTDILSGIDLLIANGVADPDRLGIGGVATADSCGWAFGRRPVRSCSAGSVTGIRAATGEGGPEADRCTCGRKDRELMTRSARSRFLRPRPVHRPSRRSRVRLGQHLLPPAFVGSASRVRL